MNFFKKLSNFVFGKPPPSEKTDDPAPPTAVEGEPIKAFDKLGREVSIPRSEWLDSVLLSNIKDAWDEPDELASLLQNGFTDGFFAEVKDAADRLHEIDSIPARGTTLLSIVYLQTDRTEKAEQLLQAYLDEHGPDGSVLTNLAKAQDDLGRKEESLATLRRGLEVDPNQDNGLAWYEAICREKHGDKGSIEALEWIAEKDGSWRAQLWLARHALEARERDRAINWYERAMVAAPRPIPTDLLMQMSGDLGNHAHIMELLDLCAPHFEVELHGMAIGNNLIKGYLDTGQIDEASAILQQLQLQQRPDWREGLSYWENELANLRHSTTDAPAPDELRLSLLNIEGPLWYKGDLPDTVKLPAKSDDAPILVILGSSFQSPAASEEVEVRLSDSAGRMTRAIPLFLGEILHLGSEATARTLIPWILNSPGGFALSGQPTSNEDAAAQGRQFANPEDGLEPADYAIVCNLLASGENWTLDLRLVRTIDAACLAEHSYDFAEAAFHRIAGPLLKDLGNDLEQETGFRLDQPEWVMDDDELDHYLLRLEQALAVCCSAMDGSDHSFLSNPAEIIDGLIFLSAQNPESPPCRFLLVRALRALSKTRRELADSFRRKIDELESEFPLPGDVAKTIADELAEIWGDES